MQAENVTPNLAEVVNGLIKKMQNSDLWPYTPTGATRHDDDDYNNSD